jgi:hypothetical protein
VRSRLLPLLLALPAITAGAEPVTRTSEPVKPATEAREGWRSPGFRLDLQLGLQILHGTETGGAADWPGGTDFSMAFEPGYRLSRTVAVSAGLRYSLVPERSQGRQAVAEGGFAWSLTANAMWFPVDAFYLAAGLGYAGVLAGCHAGGGVVLVRAGAQLVVGESMAMGPLAQLSGSVIECSDGGGSRTYLHDSVFLAWALAWR